MTFRNKIIAAELAFGSAAALVVGRVAGATADPLVTGTNTPINNFVDYGKENILAVIGVVLLGVGAIFAVSLGVKLAMKWIHRAAK